MLLGSAPLSTQRLVGFWKMFLEQRNDVQIDFGG